MIARTWGDVEHASIFRRALFAKSSRRMSSRHASANGPGVVAVQFRQLHFGEGPDVSASTLRGGDDPKEHGVVLTPLASLVSQQPRLSKLPCCDDDRFP